MFANYNQSISNNCSSVVIDPIDAEINNSGIDLSNDDSDFELEDKLYRERIIGQLQDEEQHQQHTLPSEFLLKHYKYWSLNDLSLGLNDLLQELDKELINLVNNNYLQYINLGKSIDGSLDMIHDIKIDLKKYSKELINENDQINKDNEQIILLKHQNEKLQKLKFLTEKLIQLGELIECLEALLTKFDITNIKSREEKLINKISIHGNKTQMLIELTGLWIAIGRLFQLLLKEKIIFESPIMSLYGKKMNGLKLEYAGLMKSHLDYLKTEHSDSGKNEFFEILKIYKSLKL
ncbi:hypothetical protein DAMA08_018080 [Martiniozyma asiatica (nom. inval.)]|nr:hypothetical protein DAMA08_018080 [Martiniozyma asiatica]